MERAQYKANSYVGGGRNFGTAAVAKLGAALESFPLRAPITRVQHLLYLLLDGTRWLFLANLHYIKGRCGGGAWSWSCVMGLEDEDILWDEKVGQPSAAYVHQ